MGFNAGDIEATLTVDRDPFEAGLDQAKADAEEFSGKTYSVTLDVNDNGLAKLDEFMARVNEFDFTHATAILDVDFADDAIAKVDTAEAMLVGFGAEHVTATADVNVNGADAALQGLADDVERTTTSFSGLGSSSTTVGTKLRQNKNDVDILAGGLVSVTDATTHFIGGMSAAHDANTAFDQGMKDANQGLLDVGIGMRAVEGDGAAVAQIMGGVTTEASSGGGSMDKLAASIGSVGDAIPQAWVAIGVLATGLIPIAAVATGAGIALTGAFAAAAVGAGAFALAAAGDFGKVTDTLKSEVSEWQGQLQGLVQPVVNSLTGLIGPALNALTPIVASATSAIKSDISSIGDVLHSGGFADFVGFLAGQAPNALNTFTLAAENMGQGFAGILEAFSPFISTIELGIVNLSSKFAGLANSSGLQSFASYVQQEAPVVGAFFEALIPTVGKLIGAFAPLGDAVIRVLTPILTDFGNMAPIITLAAGAMDVFARVLQPVLSSLEIFSRFAGDAAGFIGGLADKVGNFLGLTSSASDSTTQLSNALTKAGLSSKDAQKDIEDYGTSTITAMGAANFAAQQFANQIGLTASEYKALAAQSGENGSKLVSDLEKAAASAGITASAMGELELQTRQTGNAIASSLNQAASSTQSSFQSATSGISAFGGQVGVTAQSVASFYGTAQIGAQQFQSNIQSIISAKYPTALVQQVEEAGPQAGGFLQALVDAEGTGYQTQITQAFNALNKIGQEAVEEARLTQQAILSGSSQMADNLSTALSVQQTRAAQGAGATVQSVAQALNIGIPEVQAIAGIYGEAIPGAMTASQGKLFLAAQAAGQTPQQALVAAVGATQAQAEINAGIFNGALGQNLPPTQTSANTQANALQQAHLAALGATVQSAYQIAVTTPNAVNDQKLQTAVNAYDMAAGIGSGIWNASNGVFGAAASLSGGTAANMQLPSFFGVGQAAAASMAAGLNAGALSVASTAASIAASVSAAIASVGFLNSVKPGHATGTGRGTFQGWTEVGEQGPELVNFGTPVQILSNHQSQQAMGTPIGNSSNSPSVSLLSQPSVSIVVHGNADVSTAQEIGRVVSRELNSFANEMERQLNALAPV